MDLPFELMSESRKGHNREQFEMSPQHTKFEERLKKTLYFAKLPSTERPSLPLTDITVEFFQGAATRQLGKIDVSYASSVSRRACISPYAMMIGMIYAKRLRQKNSEYLDNVTSSDLFLMCMMMASKFHYDEGVDEEVFNDEWAESAHMEQDELNQLEREFLAAIDWHLFVDAEEFSSILRNIEKRIALSQGIDRGWFSYTDIDVLFTNKLSAETMVILTERLCKVVVVCTMAYLAGVLTMVLSTVIVTSLPVHLSVISQSQTQLRPTVQPLDQSRSAIIHEHGACRADSNIQMPAVTENGSDHQTDVGSSLPGVAKLSVVADLLVHFLHGVALNFGANNTHAGCLRRRTCADAIINTSESSTNGLNPHVVPSEMNNTDYGLDSLDSFTHRCSVDSSKTDHTMPPPMTTLALQMLSPACCSWDLHLERNQKPFLDVGVGFGTSSHLVSIGA